MTAPVDPDSYKRTFEQLRQGQEVLEELTRIYGRDVYVKGDTHATHIRIGQRQVLEFILSKINRANGVPEQDEEHE